MSFPHPWFRKSKNCWYVQMAGKQISLGPDKKKAMAKYRQLLQAKGIGDADDTITVHELADAYAAWIKDNRAPTTYKFRKIVLNTLKRHISESLKAVKLKPYHVDEWIKTLRVKSPNTIHARKCLVISMFHWGKRYGYINTNPVENMPKPTPQPRRDFLPAERFPELLDAAGSVELQNFIFVMLETGARTQEMVRFRADHFDGSKFTLPADEAKCKDRVRVVYLPDRSKGIAAGLAKKYTSGPIFRAPNGRPWTNNGLLLQFSRLRKTLGVPLCATTLRHSWCHYQLTHGMDPLTVAKLMGHKDLKQIARTYGHLENSPWLEQQAKNASPFSPPAGPVAPTPTGESE